MFNLYETFGTDPESEKNGFWYEYSPATEDSPATRFRLARAGGANVKYLQVTEVLSRPHRREIDAVTSSKKKITSEFRTMTNSIMAEAFATAVVLDWEGVTDKDGNIMEYNAENVVKLFTDLPDLFEEIQGEAARLANFQLELLDDDVKN